MNKAVFITSMLLVISLLITGCANSDTPEIELQEENGVLAENTPDVYVDEQIIDETEEVEIGEMI